MASTREKPVENRIKALLRARGAWLLKTQAGTYGSLVGCPDLLCCYKGRFLAIEVKAPGREATLTASQKAQQGLLRQAGAFVLTASDVNTVSRALDAISAQLSTIS